MEANKSYQELRRCSKCKKATEFVVVVYPENLREAECRVCKEVFIDTIFKQQQQQ